MSTTNNPINTVQINKPLRYAVLIGWFFSLFVVVTSTCLVTYYKVVKVRLAKSTPVASPTPSPTPTVLASANDVTKLMDEAKLAIQNSKPSEALEKLKQVINLDANNAEAYKLQADALVASNNYPDAINSYQQSITLNKENIDAYFEMGKACEQLGQDDKAILAYNSGLQIKNDLNIRLRLARALVRSNQLEEAKKNYTLVINSNDSTLSPTARQELSKVSDNRVAIAKPVKTPSPVIDVKPTPIPIASPSPEPKKVETPKIEPPKPIATPTPTLSSEDYLKRASDFYNSKDYNSTLREADKALKIAPNDLRFYYLIGGSYFALGNLPEALKAYRRCSPPSWNGTYSQQCAGRAKELEKKLK